MFRKASPYIRSIFPNLSKVADDATVDRFRRNIDDMFARLGRSSSEQVVSGLCITVLTRTTFVLIKLL